MALPAPQLQDKDLELLGKNNQYAELSGAANPATRALIGNYSQRDPTPTPMRTPRYQDVIMREAQNALALQNATTPLVGGENAVLVNPDFSGVTPKSKIPSTPNVLSSILNTPVHGGMVKLEINRF